jgi:hypothetical protein
MHPSMYRRKKAKEAAKQAIAELYMDGCMNFF